MGCISSKQAALELDTEGVHSSSCEAWKTRRAQRKERARAKKDRVLESPVVEGEAPPWVAGHAVLTKREGQYVIVERKEL